MGQRQEDTAASTQRKPQRKTKKYSERQLVSLPAANETSVDPVAAAVSSILEGIFTLKTEGKTSSGASSQVMHS